MAKHEKTISGQFEEILHHLENDIGSSGITMNLVDQSIYYKMMVDMTIVF